MSKTLATILLASALANPCYGELIFDWYFIDQAHQSVDKKKIENLVKAAALKYTETKYADKGRYDFVRCPEKIVVRFRKGNGCYESRVMCLDSRILNNKPRLIFQAFHEFSHVYYDMCINDAMTYKQGETRATRKEHMFLQEIRTRVPEEIYEKLIDCYSVGDYYEAFRLRSQILHEWSKRTNE